MTTIEPKYVSFKTAKLLQEKGFELNSSKCYNENGESKTVALTARKLLHKEKVFYPRPELWVVQEWILYKHNLWIAISNCNSAEKGFGWCYDIHRMPCGILKLWKQGDEIFDSPSFALEQGIVYCLNHLL